MAIALSSPTLGKTLSTVRNMLNQPNAANSFWSDEELIDYINEGVRMYFAEVTANAEGQFTKVTDLNIVGGTETIALPSDCYEVKGLYKLSNEDYIILPYRNMISESYSTNAASSGNIYFPAYYFRENNIVLRPVPSASETAGLRIEYIYFPDTMLDAGDVMNSGVSPIFKQLVEMYAVYKAKVKESLVNGTDTSQLAKQNLDEIYILFKGVIANRSKYPVYTIPFLPESDQ